jgi:serine/threonine protein kinase
MTVDLETRLKTELAPELEVMRRLGRGATSVVFLAREAELRRLVAIKVLRLELAADPVVRRRFEREAQSIARISHANVTVVHRVGRLSDGVPFMVMEFIEGRTFSEITAAVGALGVDEALRLLAGLAGALAAAHERGIIHRDVRPGNVFVENRTQRVVLADFGIAAVVESGNEPITRLTAVGQRIGDLRYMSPEQLQGETATAQSDIYAFGILGYELLTGKGPYEGTSPAELVRAHLDARPQDLQRNRPDLGGAVARLLEHCLDKEPNRRPSAKDLADALANPTAFEAKTGRARRGAIGEFLAELKRRRVYQVAVGYCAISLVVLEAAELVAPVLPLVEWAYPGLVIMVLGGFPIALTLSWVYDVTERGILRTSADPATALASSRSRTLAWVGLTLSIGIAIMLGVLIL